MNAWCLAAFVLAVMLTAGGAQGAGPVVVSGVDRYRYMDPNFECVRIVLARRGEKLTPEYIQGISGMAFRIGGPCPCAPTCSLALSPPDLIKALGYRCQEMPLFGQGVDPKKKVGELIDRVKAEVRAGRPTIVWHAFTFAEWDVVVGYDDGAKQFLGRGTYAANGEQLARAPEGRTATCGEICPELGAIFIGEKVGAFDAREAELSALAEAVRHAHSPQDRFLETIRDKPLPWRFRDGLACYDVWAQSFRCDPKRLPTPSGDRYPIGVYASTRTAAGKFLREIAPKYPKAQAGLLRAAAHFDADAEALAGVRELIAPGDKVPTTPDAQRNLRTAEALAAARGHYAKGIDELEAALKLIAPKLAAEARSPARFGREGNKVWIRGLEAKLTWGLDRRCTWAGALAAALKPTEKPYVYDDLMGLSALAFRVRWCNDRTKTRWCPSCAVGEMPDEQALLARQTGWSMPTEWLDLKGRDNDKLRQRIVASIDAGKPFVAYPGTWDVAVVYGYEDAGRTLLVNSYDHDEYPLRLPVEKLGPLMTFLGEYGQAPPMADALGRALQTADENWKRKTHDGGIAGREYWYGQAAFEAWAGDLENYAKLPQPSQEGFRRIHAWCVLALYDARRSAKQFLSDWSVAAPPAATPALREAAQCYGKEADLLKPLAEQMLKAPAAGPDLSDAARARRLEILRQAAQFDAAAIAAIRKALAAWQE